MKTLTILLLATLSTVTLAQDPQLLDMYLKGAELTFIFDEDVGTQAEQDILVANRGAVLAAYDPFANNTILSPDIVPLAEMDVDAALATLRNAYTFIGYLSWRRLEGAESIEGLAIANKVRGLGNEADAALVLAESSYAGMPENGEDDISAQTKILQAFQAYFRLDAALNDLKN